MDMILIAVVMVVIVVVILAFIIKLIPAPSKTNEIPIYELAGPVLTNAELSFYAALRKAVADEHEVHFKVRIADVLKPRKNPIKGAWQKAFNRISSKHFDFVLCEHDNMTVICAIELDDKSHNTKRVQARDELVKDACLSAGLPLIRFPAKRGYRTSDIRDALGDFLDAEIDDASNAFTPRYSQQSATMKAIETRQLTQKSQGQQASSAHIGKNNDSCPKCASPLVRRKATKGKKSGQLFDACAGYPTCRFIRSAYAHTT